jgi:lipid II:glycine glycyltransferase (peptidoglycan interpeptide bridge formation enzyme)
MEVRSNEKIVGYFVGARRWLGIGLVTAPSTGTGTYTQGLCMLQETTQKERIDIYRQLAQHLFKNHMASYLQICDYELRNTEDPESAPILDSAGINYNPRLTYVIDLQPSEEELWQSLHYKSCKYCINKARKEGLRVRVVETSEEITGFARRHSQHLQDMMRRKHSKGLPCQRHKNILALCQSLFSHNVLMLEVVTPDGLSIASGIFAYTPNGTATYFTAASLEKYMHLCPNELLVWEAMRTLHSKGVDDLILGGVAHYKKKYAPTLAFVPVIIFSRYRILLNMRKNIKQLYQRLMYRGTTK